MNQAEGEGGKEWSGSGAKGKEGRQRGERWLEASWLPWMANRGDGVDDWAREGNHSALGAVGMRGERRWWGGDALSCPELG